jgi:hypothetical protein
MPLEVLLSLVVGGIAAIAGLLHLLGLSQQPLLSPEDAHSHWHRHFPDDLINAVHMTQDNHAALVETDQGPGLLWSFGADTVARHLLDFDALNTDNGLRIRFHDYTAPAVTLQLSDADRPLWNQVMGLT